MNHSLHHDEERNGGEADSPVLTCYPRTVIPVAVPLPLMVPEIMTPRK